MKLVGVVTFQYGDREVRRLDAVVSQKSGQTWSETHVSGGGSRFDGNGYRIMPIQSRTIERAKEEVWFRFEDGRETRVISYDSDIAVRPGNAVSIYYFQGRNGFYLSKVFNKNSGEWSTIRNLDFEQDNHAFLSALFLAFMVFAVSSFFGGQYRGWGDAIVPAVAFLGVYAVLAVSQKSSVEDAVSSVNSILKADANGHTPSDSSDFDIIKFSVKPPLTLWSLPVFVLTKSVQILMLSPSLAKVASGFVLKMTGLVVVLVALLASAVYIGTSLVDTDGFLVTDSGARMTEDEYVRRLDADVSRISEDEMIVAERFSRLLERYLDVEPKNLIYMVLTGFSVSDESVMELAHNTDLNFAGVDFDSRRPKSFGDSGRVSGYLGFRAYWSKVLGGQAGEKLKILVGYHFVKSRYEFRSFRGVRRVYVGDIDFLSRVLFGKKVRDTTDGEFAELMINFFEQSYEKDNPVHDLGQHSDLAATDARPMHYSILDGCLSLRSGQARRFSYAVYQSEGMRNDVTADAPERGCHRNAVWIVRDTEVGLR